MQLPGVQLQAPVLQFKCPHCFLQMIDVLLAIFSDEFGVPLYQLVYGCARLKPLILVHQHGLEVADPHLAVLLHGPHFQAAGGQGRGLGLQVKGSRGLKILDLGGVIFLK
jgi:hypothetical protein